MWLQQQEEPRLISEWRSRHEPASGAAPAGEIRTPDGWGGTEPDRTSVSCCAPIPVASSPIGCPPSLVVRPDGPSRSPRARPGRRTARLAPPRSRASRPTHSRTAPLAGRESTTEKRQPAAGDISQSQAVSSLPLSRSRATGHPVCRFQAHLPPADRRSARQRSPSGDSTAGGATRADDGGSAASLVREKASLASLQSQFGGRSCGTRPIKSRWNRSRGERNIKDSIPPVMRLVWRPLVVLRRCPPHSIATGNFTQEEPVASLVQPSALTHTAASSVSVRCRSLLSVCCAGHCSSPARPSLVCTAR